MHTYIHSKSIRNKGYHKTPLHNNRALSIRHSWWNYILYLMLIFI